MGPDHNRGVLKEGNLMLQGEALDVDHAHLASWPLVLDVSL